MSKRKEPNSFTLGSQIGGSVPDFVLKQEQQLRNLMNSWTGSYCSTIREFAFLLRVDGDIQTYTQIWNIEGPQKAKRKRDWVEVEVGIPESWWRENGGQDYKSKLAGSIEAGLLGMIALLQRNKHRIDADALLDDWAKVKRLYLGSVPDFDDADSAETHRQLQVFKEIQERYSGTFRALSKKLPIQ